MQSQILAWLRTATLIAIALAIPRVAAAQYDSLPRIHRDSLGNTLPYRLFSPPGHDEPGASFPLVVHLHGVGERGTDNSRQLLFIDDLIEETQTTHPAYLLVPQAAPNDSWSSFYSDGLSTSSRLTLEAIAFLEERLPIDSTRKYITGLSMGGFGTYDIIAKHPDMFAAAAPLSGYGDPSRAEDYLKTRIWTWHGSNDESVPVGPDRVTIQAIRDAGGDPLYTELPAGHNIWPPIYEDPTGEFYAWMFDGVRPDVVDFTYDPATGDVQIDATQSPGGAIDSLNFALNRRSPLFDPSMLMTAPEHVFVDGVAVPTEDLLVVPGGSRLVYTGGEDLSGVLRIPGLLPKGWDFLTLSELGYGQFYTSPETGANRRYFSLRTGTVSVVPEPTGLALLTGCGVLLAVRRRLAR